MNEPPRIEKLSRDHQVDRFDCGQEALNRFLVRYALQNQQAEASRTLQAAQIAGIRAMAAHAKDDGARAFYERFGFIPAPTDPYHLFVLPKDVRAILRQR